MHATLAAAVNLAAGIRREVLMFACQHDVDAAGVPVLGHCRFGQAFKADVELGLSTYALHSCVVLAESFTIQRGSQRATSRP